MNKEFVSYEQALELKELGFDEPCLGFYNHQGQLILMTQEDENSIEVYKNSYVKLGKQYAVPLYQQAFRWFREKYGLIPTIRPFSKGETFFFSIIGEDEDFTSGSKEFTYEEAELECLVKLIEIVKQNNNE
jgi:hypothetical protein